MAKTMTDIEEIRRLKHDCYAASIDRYIGLSDRSSLNKLTERFTDDVRAHFTGLDLIVGKPAVSHFFEVEVHRRMRWCRHRVSNEVIDVEGNEARAQWYVDCPFVYREGNPRGREGPGLIIGRYEERYRLDQGLWKFTEIIALLEVFAPADAPWKDAEYLVTNGAV